MEDSEKDKSGKELKVENEKNNSSFVRWQGRTIEELGKAINLLLTLCLATLGFVISKILDKDFQFKSCFGKCFIMIGSFVLLISIALILYVIYNRLKSFRNTAQIARKREKNELEGIRKLRKDVNEMDDRTWNFFSLSIIAFCIGEAFAILGLIFEAIKRI